jgi:hypothetical protein
MFRLFPPVYEPEGDGPSVYATFTVTLSEASTETVTVDFTTADGTAIAGGGPGADEYDYGQTSGTVTFAPGETSHTITVQILPDYIAEPTENFYVNLSNPTNATIVDDQGIGTILGEEPPTLTIDDQTVDEAAGTMTFTVTMSNPSSQDVTFDYGSADETALDGSDYTALSGSGTIVAGTTSTTITVDITDDNIAELTETFQMNLSNASNATIADPQGIGTILDNDLPSLIIDDQTVNEDAGTMTFTVTMSNLSTQDVTFDYGSADGTAIAGQDYTALSGTGTIAAGSTSTTITVSITDDNILEPTENFVMNLTNAVNATIADPQGIGTILDNYVPPPPPPPELPTISISDAEPVHEPSDQYFAPASNGDNGYLVDGTFAEFTVTLSAASTETVTVDFTTANGTAIAGGDPGVGENDYGQTSGTVIFAPGETSHTITVQILPDYIAEPIENFYVNLSNPTNATIVDDQGIGTILGDEPPTLTIDDQTVDEAAGTMTFTVTMSNPSSQEVTFDYGSADGTATDGLDYTAVSGTGTIAAGATSTTITVDITDDNIFEVTENFVMNLSNAVNATIADNQGVGTITDNDALPSFSINDVTVSEADGTITFTVTKAGLTTQASSVDYDVAPNTAVEGDPGDYTAGTSPLSGTLNFAAGETTQTITLDITDDTIYELEENFYVNLDNAVAATITDNQGVGTITDNEEFAVKDTVSDDDDAGENTYPSPIITSHTGTISDIDASLSLEIVEQTAAETGLTSNGDGVSTSWDDATKTLTVTADSVTVFTIVVSGSSYTFTQFEAIDHDATPGEDHFIPVNFTAIINGGSGGSADFIVNIYDSMVHGPGSDMVIEANSPFTIPLTDLTGITLSEDETTSAWDIYNMPTGLTYDGDPIQYSVDGSTGNLLGTAGGTLVFEASIDLSGAVPQYTFDLKVGPIGIPETLEKITDVTGGNTEHLELTFEDTIVAHLRAEEGGGATATVNTNNGTIGISDGQRINPGETLFMSFSEPYTSPASPVFTTVDGLNFTAEYSGSNDDIEVEWSAVYVDGSNPPITATGDESTLDGLLEFSIKPPAGYTIESVTITSPDDGDFQGDFKLAFSIEGDISYEDMNFDLPYTLTDYDGDATNGVISVNLDSDLENHLYSDDGDDVMVTGATDDVIDSGDGNDVISSGAGDDIINAGDGNDYIDGGAGADTIDGGAGDDTIVFDAADSHVDGGLGYDTLLVADTTGLNFSNVDTLI